MSSLRCPVCGNALAACCAATVLLRDPQSPASDPQPVNTGPATDPQATATGPAKTRKGAATDPQTPVAHVLGSRSKASKAQPKYTTEFLTFWGTYPRKKDKASAFRAFAACVRDGVDPQVLIAGAAKYATDPQRKDEFTKYPATWINARGWEDEEDAPVERSNGKRNAPAFVGTPEWIKENRPWELEDV